MISQVLFTSEQPTKNKMAFVGVIVANKVALLATSYSVCVVYTKTIIMRKIGKINFSKFKLNKNKLVSTRKIIKTKQKKKKKSIVHDS